MTPGTQILIVDDDPLMRSILETYLKCEHSAATKSVANGLQALTLLQDCHDKVALIICDLNMPEMDGLQFLRHVHELGYEGKLAIVSGEDPSVLSATKDIATFYGFDLVGVFSKPLDTKKLREISALSAPHAPNQSGAEAFDVTPQGLHDAMAQQHIVLFYQPKMDIRTGKITGAEALARWLDPEFGVINPSQFIDKAQSNGQMPSLSANLLRQAVRACGAAQMGSG